jgi:hypothetical protein
VTKSDTSAKVQLAESSEKLPKTRISASVKENSEKDLRIARLEKMILELSKKLDFISNPGLKKDMLIHPAI